MEIRSVFLAFVFVIFFSFGIDAQEVISNVESVGNEHVYTFHDYEGESFIFKASSMDSLDTYKVIGEDLVLQQRTYVKGTYDLFYQYRIGRFLLFEGENEAHAYDFINDEITYFEAEGNLTELTWIEYEHDIAILSKSSKDKTKKMKYVMNSDLVVLLIMEPNNFLYQVTEDYFVFSRTENGQLIYNTEDRVTGENTESFSMPSEIFRVSDGEVLFYYNEETSELIKHDFMSHETEVIFTSSIELSYYELSETEHQFFLLGEHHETDLYFTFVINKKDKKTKLLEDASITIFNPSFEDVVIYRGVDWDTKLYDFEKDEITSLDYRPAHTIVSIGERYLMYEEDDANYLYDIKTENKTQYFFDFPEYYLRHKEEIKIGDKYYVDLGLPKEEMDDVIIFDESNMTMVNGDILPKSKHGLIETTKITKYGKDILVTNEENLYAIENDNFVQLNEGEIKERSIQQYNNGLAWEEKSDENLTLFQYVNKEKTKVSVFTKMEDPDIYNLTNQKSLVGNSTVLISGNLGTEEALKVINKSDNSVVVDLGHKLDFFGLHSFFEEFYYVSSSPYFLRISELGNIDTLYEAEDGWIVLRSFVFDDNLFCTDSNNFFSIKGGEVRGEVLSSGDIPFFGLFEKWRGYLTLRAAGQSTSIYLNEEWEILWPDNRNKNELPILFDNYIQVSGVQGTDFTDMRLFNALTNEFIEMPEELEDKTIVESFDKNNKKYLFALEEGILNNTVILYEMTDNFSSLSEVTSFQASGNSIEAYFELYGTEGLLSVGSEFYRMSPKFDFEQVGYFPTDKNSILIDNLEGSFYFIAIHPERGRQVFTLSQIFGPKSTENAEVSDIEIYPNPAQDALQWKSNLFQDEVHSIDIYNMQGKWMMTTTANIIDISDLQEGMHVAVFSSMNGEVLGSSRFVKMGK